MAIDLSSAAHRAVLVEGAHVVESRRLLTPRFERSWTDAVARLAQEWRGRFDAAALAGPEDPELAADLVRRLGMPVPRLDPAVAACWAEHRFGAGRGGGDTVHVNLGREVAGAVVLDGRLLEGAHGAAGRIGRMPAGDGGRCLDDILAGSALVSRGYAHGARDAGGIAAAAALGSGWATALLDEAAAALAQALRAVQALLDPARIVLGGALGASPDFLGRVSAALAGPGARPQIVRAELGEDAAAIGAADHAACTTPRSVVT